jgi:hypothetical protein
MDEIAVPAIHNRTAPPKVVHLSIDGVHVEVAPGETLEGPFAIHYDPEEHPELVDVPSPNEVWYVRSADAVRLGTVRLWRPPE